MRREILHLESVDSTNTYLKEAARNGAADGTVVIAARQTAGRGRTGNSFASADGGLYCSMLFRTEELELSETVSLTTRAGVAASDAVSAVTGIAPGIKWVNDLILNGKKIAGILVEAGPFSNERIPYAVVGIGINVNQTAFPEELAGKASSLRLECGRAIRLSEAETALIRYLDLLRAELRSGGDRYLQTYRERCVTLGKTVCFDRNGVSVLCKAVGITEEYGLQVVHTDGREETLRSGEVRVRGIDGYLST